MKRWYMAILLIIVFGVLFAFIMPAFINYSIERTVIETLRRDYGVKPSSYVSVKPGFFAPLMGRVEYVHVECYRRDLNGIQADNLVVTLRDIRFNLRQLILSRKITIKKIGSATARIVLGEAEINRYIMQNNPDLEGWEIDFTPGKVAATAEIEMLGMLNITFKPRLRGDKLILEPDSARFYGEKNLGSLGLAEAQNWIDKIELGVPVANLPFGMKVTRVVFEDNRLEVTAKNEQ